MQLTSISFDEELRLEDLYSYDILDNDAEKEFDDILEIATYISGCPMSAVTFIDKQRQWVKAQKGMILHQGDRDAAFCSHTILQKEPLLVPDAAADKRFANSPFVTGSPHFRFYAGAPVISAAGFPLGAVCIMDNRPRDLPSEQLDMLNILSRQVSKLLELRLKNRVLKQQAIEEMTTQRKVLRRTLEQQEALRLTWGSQLHEEIAQGLAATKFYLDLAGNSSNDHSEVLAKSKSSISDLLAQVKTLSANITPSTLQGYDLRAVLLDLTRRFENNTKIETQLTYKGVTEIDQESSMCIYRVVEDHLQNIRQHAKAGRIVVQIACGSKLLLSIRDNGVGIDETNFKKGADLGKILARVEQLGGSVALDSPPSGGCELRVELALRQHR